MLDRSDGRVGSGPRSGDYQAVKFLAVASFATHGVKYRIDTPSFFLHIDLFDLCHNGWLLAFWGLVDLCLDLGLAQRNMFILKIA